MFLIAGHDSLHECFHDAATHAYTHMCMPVLALPFASHRNQLASADCQQGAFRVGVRCQGDGRSGHGRACHADRFGRGRCWVGRRRRGSYARGVCLSLPVMEMVSKTDTVSVSVCLCVCVVCCVGALAMQTDLDEAAAGWPQTTRTLCSRCVSLSL